MLSEMKLLILRSGITEKQYQLLESYSLPANPPGEISEKLRLQFLDDLKVIKDKEYADAEKVWKYITPEMWDNYKAFGIHGLTEQELLKQCLQKLRLVILELGKKSKALRKGAPVRKVQDQVKPASESTEEQLPLD